MMASKIYWEIYTTLLYVYAKILIKHSRVQDTQNDTMHKINAGDLEILHISKIIVIYHQIRLKEFTDHAENKQPMLKYFYSTTT